MQRGTKHTRRFESVGGAAALYFRYIAGEFSGFTAAATFPRVNGVSYTPIEIPTRLTIDRFGCGHGGVAAGNYYQGIYNSVNEAPMNLLGTSALMACAGVTQKQQAALTVPSLQLARGLYFLALTCDNNTDSYIAYVRDELRFPANVNDGPSWYYEARGVWATLPLVATPLFEVGYLKLFEQWVRVLSIP